MWVVKLGGSMAQSPALKDWLSCLAEHGSGRVVVVPGGGPFAEQVRSIQRQWHFPDTCAHRMALTAMDQYGVMINGLEQRCVPVSTEHEIDEQLRHGLVPVWLPSRLLAENSTIRASWDVTSDSIAAWLCHRLTANHLVLVKSAKPIGRRIPVSQMTAAGIVDAEFHHYLAHVDFASWWLHTTDSTSFGPILNKQRIPQTLITAEEILTAI